MRIKYIILFAVIKTTLSKYLIDFFTGDSRQLALALKVWNDLVCGFAGFLHSIIDIHTHWNSLWKAIYLGGHSLFTAKMGDKSFEFT